MRVRPGRPYPLGATLDEHGVNFSIFSEHAAAVELCLFDRRDATVETHRITLPEQTEQVWHGYLPDIGPGQLYGYRIAGPYAPPAGHRFNPAKLLLDPYATQIGRTLIWHDALCDEPSRSGCHGTPDSRDTAPWAPLGVVADPAFDWGTDRPPRTPWPETVIYELHVKGFSWRHPEVPGHLRGTYSGLASAPMLHYLQALGVTAVELLPVHQHATEWALVDRGLTNYCGYNSLAFLAPDIRYTTTADTAVREFKTMVRRLHAAGLEGILDVVYNHTAEGDRHGPTLSWRGIDNAAYYLLRPDDPATYLDYTGCGNTLDMRHPRVLQLVMDSLRYWVQDMHVDGFRFDLASALARERSAVDMGGRFVDILRQDPVLSQVKLIAEPWDLGRGGYQVGRFPAPFREWNDQFRNTVRRFWRGDVRQVAALATRLAGSRDLYWAGDRSPTASVNFLTAHDGFTLADLVSYRQRRNDDNGEANRDGADDNRSWNCGVEGPSDDPEVKALRARMRRSLLATLVLSQGVPMLTAGDETGRTQLGNNNAYCQDNETSWLDWRLSPDADRFLAFVREVVAFRGKHPVLRHPHFLRGGRIGEAAQDLAWFDSAGGEMTDASWHAKAGRCVGMRLDGAGMATDDVEVQGQQILDDTVLVLLNAGRTRVDFSLPEPDGGGSWRLVFDTADERAVRRVVNERTYPLRDHAVAVLLTPRERTPRAVRTPHASERPS